MKYLIACTIVCLFLFSGCKIFEPSEWKSQKRINKVEHYHPYLLAQYCAKEFPIKRDSAAGTPTISKTSTEIPGPIILVDCDSVMRVLLAQKRDSAASNERQVNNTVNQGLTKENGQKTGNKAPATVYVQCPPSTQDRETVTVPVYITETSTADLKAEQDAHAKTRTDRDKKAGQIKLLWWVAGIEFIIIVLLVVGGVLLWKFKIKNLIKPATG